MKKMSRLSELIEQLCPDGVEYKTLGEIATDIYRGSGIKRDQITDEGISCVRYGEIYTTYGVWFDKCVSHTTLENISSPKYFEHGDILFAITGESVEDIAKSTAYVGYEKCLAGGDIVIMKHNQDPKYLAYALSTRDAQKQKSAGKVKSKVVHSSVPAIKEIRVAVPPLEVQREVVRILDIFMSLSTELEANLFAELAARQKQYEFYRNKILTFQNNIPMQKLGDFCDILTGYPFDSAEFKNNGIRLMRGMNIKRGFLEFNDTINKYWEKSDGLEKYLLVADDIVISMDGSLVGKSYGIVKDEDLPLLLVQRVAHNKQI